VNTSYPDEMIHSDAIAVNTGDHYYETETHRFKGELLQQAEEGGPSASPKSPEACFLMFMMICIA
jgi:hypothetical protein